MVVMKKSCTLLPGKLTLRKKTTCQLSGRPTLLGGDSLEAVAKLEARKELVDCAALTPGS